MYEFNSRQAYHKQHTTESYPFRVNIKRNTSTDLCFVRISTSNKETQLTRSHQRLSAVYITPVKLVEPAIETCLLDRSNDAQSTVFKQDLLELKYYQVIKLSGKNSGYFLMLKDGKKHLIWDWDTFTALGLSYSDVVTLTSEDFHKIETGLCPRDFHKIETGLCPRLGSQKNSNE